MYVEDLITQVVDSYRTSVFKDEDSEFVISIGQQVKDGRTLTSRQAYAIRKVLAKYANDCRYFIPTMTERDWSACLNGNLWRNTPRVTVQKRNEARYLGDNLVGLSYQYNRDLAEETQRLRAVWRNGVQTLGVHCSNIDALIDLLGTYKFEIDDVLENYLVLCLDSKAGRSHFIADDEAVVCNVCDSDTLASFLLHIVGAERI